MNEQRFDSLTQAVARRLSRRQALAQGGAGLAASALAALGLGGTTASAQEASPIASPAAESGEKTFYLFVQSFQSGSIAPKAGDVGTYTVALDHGLGQTIYFADRPSRDVGAVPTPQFLAGIGFDDDNPPNAALVVEPAPGQTDIAVVELFNPVYDETGPNLTYDVEVLANWQNELELGFSEAPTDLAALVPNFGPAHLFIDDCPDRALLCVNNDREAKFGGHYGFCWSLTKNGIGLFCVPCWRDSYYENECNTQWPDYCQGDCDIHWRRFG